MVKDRKTGEVVPLVGLKVSARVNHTTAEVVLAARFENSSKTNPIEAVMHIADEGMIVHAFDVCIGDSIVQGVCMEREEAFAKYDDEISSGNAAFLAEKSAKRQTFDISAGNLPPGMVCVVNVRYTTILETIGDEFVFGLPVTRTVPLNGPSNDSKMNVDSELEDSNSKLRAQVPNGLNLNIAISQPQRILSITCPSHSKPVSSINQHGSVNNPSSDGGLEINRFDMTGSVVLSQVDVEPKRFELRIEVADPHQPSCITEAVQEKKKEEGKNLEEIGSIHSPLIADGSNRHLKEEEAPFDQIQQYPDVIVADSDELNQNQIGRETKYKKYALALSVLPKIRREDVEAKSEIIFLLDCSGSMSGGRMRRAKSALALFLRAIPESCRFNIYAFGDNHMTLFDTPQIYNESTLARAIKWVDERDAKLGGTNLLAPFQEMLATPLSQGWTTRQVFLLTDGDVTNKAEVLSHIKKNIGDCTRIFAFGIGNEVSQALMKGIAKYGRGKAEFVESTTPLEAPVMRQVQRALQPALENFKIEWGNLRPAPQGIAPNIPPVFDGERFDYFAFFEAPVDALSGALVSTVHEIKIKASFAPSGDEGEGENQNTFEFPCVVDLNASDMELAVQRLAAHSEIEEMQKRAKNYKAEIIRLATKYHLASKYTSFIAVHVSDKKDATQASMMTIDAGAALNDARSEPFSAQLQPAEEESSPSVLDQIGSTVENFFRDGSSYLKEKVKAFQNENSEENSLPMAPRGCAHDRLRSKKRLTGSGLDVLNKKSDLYDAAASEGGDDSDFEDDIEISAELDDADGMVDARRRMSVSEVLKIAPESLSGGVPEHAMLIDYEKEESRSSGRAGVRKETSLARNEAPALHTSASSRVMESVASFGSAVANKMEEFFSGLDEAPPSFESESRERRDSEELKMKDSSDKNTVAKRKMAEKQKPHKPALSSSKSGAAAPKPAVMPAPITPSAQAMPPPPPPASQSSSFISAPAEPSVQVPKATSAMELVMLAQANGSFALDVTLAGRIGLSLAKILDSLPAALQGHPDVWATALAIAALEKFFQSTKDEWGLIYTKGRRFISKQITLLKLDTTIDSLLETASQTLL